MYAGVGGDAPFMELLVLRNDRSMGGLLHSPPGGRLGRSTQATQAVPSMLAVRMLLRRANSYSDTYCGDDSTAEI